MYGTTHIATGFSYDEVHVLLGDLPLDVLVERNRQEESEHLTHNIAPHRNQDEARVRGYPSDYKKRKKVIRRAHVILPAVMIVDVSVKRCKCVGNFLFS
jgi:hypothetical protein